jgi:hypothetical protein
VIAKIGDRLTNGAIIVDMKQAWAPDGYIVLCVWTEDWQGVEIGDTPPRRKSDLYVTWVLFPDTEIDEFGVQARVRAHNGHYFDQLSDAVVDFNSRT